MQVTTPNQVGDIADYNKYTTDLALRAAVAKWSSFKAHKRLEAYGARLGSLEVREWGVLANEHPPAFQAYTRLGEPSNRIDFHPAWHSLMRLAMQYGVHNRAWCVDQPGSHVERAAAFFMHGQVEAGSLCPLTMTSAAIPVVMQEPELASVMPHLGSDSYDPRDLPITHKNAIVIGMGLTERQGGSDLRQTQTTATLLNEVGSQQTYTLKGKSGFIRYLLPMRTSFWHAVSQGYRVFCATFERERPSEWYTDSTPQTETGKSFKCECGSRV